MEKKEKKYRYFLYSTSQYKLRTEVESKIGRKFIPGKVMVNGVWKDYTEISITPNNNRFADAKIVAKGYIEDINYQDSQTVIGR